MDYWSESSSSGVHCETRLVAEARAQFRNPEEEKCPPFEAVTRGLVKRQQT
jgi:hypothetical protein